MRRRILSSIVAVTILAVVLFGVPLAVAVRLLYFREATLTLEREATEAARSVPANFRSDRDALQLPKGSPRVGLGLYDPSGAKVSGLGPDTGDRSVQDARSNRITDTRRRDMLVVSVPITGNERLVAVVRAEESLNPVNARVYRAWLLMAAIGAVSVGVAAVVARRQARRLTEPVVQVRAAATALGDGDFTVTVAPTGIRELDDVGEAITATAVRLGELVEQERAFTTDASHQLRTPLTGLRLGIETELASPNPDLEGALNGALTQIDRLSDTVDHLLALARDRTTPHSVIAVPELLETAEHTWHGLFEAGGRTLVVQAAEDAHQVMGSARAVGQILDVLLGNALAHGAGTARLDVHRVAGGTAFVVEDEGEGIARSPESLFDRRRVSADGHGIGLGLARRLAEAEGGRLTVRRTRPHPQFELLLPDEVLPRVNRTGPGS